MTNFIQDVGFTLLTLRDLQDRSLANRVLDILMNGPAFTKPEHFGFADPVDTHIDPADLSPVIAGWMGAAYEPGAANGLLLLEFCPSGDFMISWEKGVNPRGIPAKFHSISGGIPLKRLRKCVSRSTEYQSLIEQLVSAVDPVFGMIQNCETPHWDTPYDLTLRLPDIPWGSFFGRPYIDMFGRDKLLRAPFHSVKELPSGHIFAQLTESIMDPELPQERRAAVREWLGEDCFMVGKAAPRSYTGGRTPDFKELRGDAPVTGGE